MEIMSDEFDRLVTEACNSARLETLAAGVPVFYLDRETGMDIMEQPDGRRFQIRYIPGAPRDRHFEIVREIVAPAA
jgi:hypothetical protein